MFFIAGITEQLIEHEYTSRPESEDKLLQYIAG